MKLAAQAASDTLQLRHHYPYSPQQVFAAWSNQEAIGNWFGPHSHRCQVEQYDFRQGGHYQIRLIQISEDSDCSGEAGVDSVCAGEFVKINPAKEIVMTFTWIEGGGEIGETLLTIEFLAAKGGTDVVLTHERLPDDTMRKAHQGGWQGTLECLAQYLTQTIA